MANNIHCPANQSRILRYWRKYLDTIPGSCQAEERLYKLANDDFVNGKDIGNQLRALAVRLPQQPRPPATAFSAKW